MPNSALRIADQLESSSNGMTVVDKFFLKPERQFAVGHSVAAHARLGKFKVHIRSHHSIAHGRAKALLAMRLGFHPRVRELAK